MTTQTAYPEYQYKVTKNGKTKDGDKIQVNAYLHYLEGNDKPYFSVTGNSKDSGGCMHEEILKAFPEMAPIIDLHLSNMDGVPSHGFANGLYWLKENEIDALASHLRITKEKALQMRNDYLVVVAIAKTDDSDDETKNGQLEGKVFFTDYFEAQIPRFNKEAEDAIELLKEWSETLPPALPFHDQQAKDLLDRTGVTLSKSLLRTDRQKNNDALITDVYQIDIMKGETVFSFEYFNSHQDSGPFVIKHRQQKKTEDVLKVCSEAEARKIWKEAVSNGYNSMTAPKSKEANYLRKIVYKYDTSSIGPNFNFWLHKNKDQKAPSDYDILACLQKYDVGSFSDFCGDFGYDDQPMSEHGEIMKTYQAVKSEYTGVLSIWNGIDLEELSDIQ